MTIKSWKAFVIWMTVLFICFIWSTLKPSAPFSVLAEWGTIGFLGYITKRVAQKAKWFIGGENGEAPPSQGQGK